MTKFTVILIVFISFLSCKDDRELKYSGFDDLMVGSKTINLFDNGEFSIELGLGYKNGTYKIENDTIFLTYSDSTDFPKRFLLKNDKIVSLDTKKETSIRRTDNYRAENSKIEIPQGKFKYEIYFAEFGGRMKNQTCKVEIKNSNVVITQVENINLTGGKTIFEGKILKHKSGKWILSNKQNDINADEIGGCTEIPIIDFDKKLIEWC